MSRGILGLLLWIVTSLVLVSANAEPQINLGNIPAGKTVTISYDVTVNNNATGNEVSSQATVTGDNFADILSDDPSTVLLNDATKTGVDAADTMLQLIASDATPTTTENVTFTATVESTNNLLPVPTGNVEFRIDGGAANTVALDAGGVATFDMPFAVGSYNVTADYVGSAEYVASSNSVSIVAGAANTTTTITGVNPAVIYPADNVTVSFDVNIEAAAAGLPLSGSVQVTDGTDSCSASVGVGSCDIQFTAPGAKDLVATFISGSSELANSSSAVTTVEVINTAPAIATIGNQSVEATNLLSFDVDASDSDPGSTISYSLAAGSPAGAMIDLNSGLFTWTPTEAQGGNVYNIIIIATDQYNATDSETVSVDVSEKDNPPSAVDDVVVTDEDSNITFAPLANDAEERSFDYSTLTVVSEPNNGTLSVNNLTGEMTYQPQANFNGSDQAQYKVSDNTGNESNVATINFTINAVNDAPVIESQPLESAVEYTEYQYDIVATDEENDHLQITLLQSPAWLQLMGNSLVGTPYTSDIGQHDIEINVTDGIDTSVQVFTITVAQVDASDISLTQQTSTISPLVGETFDLSYTVTNSGPSISTSTELSIDLTGDINVIESDERCIETGLSLNCDIGTMNIDQVEDIVLKVQGQGVGDVYSYAKIITDEDHIDENNESGLGVSVTQDIMSDKAATIGESASNIVLTADLDDDGKDDILLLQQGSILGSVYGNLGSNSFEKRFDIQGGYTPTAAKLGLINDDQYLDLVVATKDMEPTLVFLGGNNGFSLAQTLQVSDSNDIDMQDINADGYSDIVVANDGANDVYLSDGQELQLSHQFDDSESTAILLRDIDGDGLVDATVGAADGYSYFYDNSQLMAAAVGSTNFTQIDTGLVSDISAIDVDQDGVADLLFASAVDTGDYARVPVNKVFKWSGGLNQLQTFGAVDSRNIIVIDIDSDGDEDVFVLNKNGAHQVYLNQAGTLSVTDKLLVNVDGQFAAWIVNESGGADLILAEDIVDEGSALYANQGGGNFGLAETDLALSYTANVSTVTEDGVIEAQLIVTNNGPSSAQGVELSASISAQLNVIRFGSGADMCNVADTAMNCTLGNVMPGDRITIPLRLLAMNTGEATIKAEVTSPIDDLNPANNSQQVTIKVTPRRDSGGGQMGYLLLLILALITWRRKFKIS